MTPSGTGGGGGGDNAFGTRCAAAGERPAAATCSQVKLQIIRRRRHAAANTDLFLNFADTKALACADKKVSVERERSGLFVIMCESV